MVNMRQDFALIFIKNKSTFQQNLFVLALINFFIAKITNLFTLPKKECARIKNLDSPLCRRT
jgi:hypothetical protein